MIETAANPGGWSSPDTSVATGVVQPPPPPVAPSNVSPPQILGTAAIGQTLNELHGQWTYYPTSYTYQWEDCNAQGTDCSIIPGATSHTYTVTASDSWQTIRVIETAINAAGPSNPASSPPTAVVQGLPPANTAPPQISGQAAAGQTLSASHGSWTQTPTGYSYQWEACDASGANCKTISGATSATYTLTSANVGNTIRVLVTALTPNVSSSPVSSAPTGVVTQAKGPTSTGPTQTGPVGTVSPHFAASMWNSLAASGKAAAIPALLKNHGYTFAFTAPSAGKLVVAWYATIKHKQVLVAKTSTTLRGAGKAKVKVALTGTGRQLLKKSKRIALTADGTFTAGAQSSSSGPKKFGVKH